MIRPASARSGSGLARCGSRPLAPASLGQLIEREREERAADTADAPDGASRVHETTTRPQTPTAPTPQACLAWPATPALLPTQVLLAARRAAERDACRRQGADCPRDRRQGAATRVALDQVPAVAEVRLTARGHCSVANCAAGAVYHMGSCIISKAQQERRWLAAVANSY